MTWIMAQSDNPVGSILGPLLVLLVLGSALVFGVSILRKKLRADDSVARDFSLGDLRRLRAEGKITQDELDRAKMALVGRAQSELKKPEPSRNPEPATEVK